GVLVEVEGGALHRRRGHDLRPAGSRTARFALHRLHLRRLARRGARSLCQSLLGPDRRGDPSAGQLDPTPYGGTLRTRARGSPRAGVRARLRGDPAFAATSLRGGGALPPHRALAHGQTGRRGRYAGDPVGVDGEMTRSDPILRTDRWFASLGRRPFDYQREVWSAYRAGESGLVHAATGTGKTLAAWIGPLLEWMEETAGTAAPRRRGRAGAPPLRVLWITPLR